MSLRFAADGDRVDFGSASDIDSGNLPELTVLCWCNPTTVVFGSQLLFGKNTATFLAGFHCTLMGNAAGSIQMQRKAVSDTRFRSPNGTLSSNVWQFLAFVFHPTETVPSGEIHLGTLTMAAAETTPYALTDDMSGALVDDSSANLYLGNSPANTALEFKGDIGVFCIVDRVLTSAEIISWQWHPRWIDGTLLLTWPDGTGTQADYSGTGKSGTVTGATQSTRGLPLGPRFGFDEYAPYTGAAPPASVAPSLLSLLGVG
jgi:hypothetical protein